MTCRNIGCRHEFCWNCFGDWNTHGGLECDKKQIPISFNQHMHRIKRFRVAFDQQAMKQDMEKDFYEKIESNKSHEGISYFDTALKIVLQCRQTLKYSFVFCFYINTYCSLPSVTFEKIKSV